MLETAWPDSARVLDPNHEPSAPSSSFPSVGLCFSFLRCFLLSCRREGGGVPRTSLAIDLTADDAINLRIFFFFGKDQFNHTGHRDAH